MSAADMNNGAAMSLEESAAFQYKTYACREAVKRGYSYVLWREPCSVCGSNAIYATQKGCVQCAKTQRTERYIANRDAELEAGNIRKRNLRVQNFHNAILKLAKKNGIYKPVGDADIDAANEKLVIEYSYELLGTFRGRQMLSAYVNMHLDARGLFDD